MIFNVLAGSKPYYMLQLNTSLSRNTGSVALLVINLSKFRS